MARAISKARLRLVLLLTLLTGMVFAGVVPAHAAGTASISGTVTVPAGADVTQAVVLLLVETPEGYTMPDAEITPDATGAYTFAEIWPGRYKIVFAHPATTVVWNGGASTEETAPWIELAEGQSVTGADATLALAGSIAGTVSFAAGADPEQVVVSAFLDGSYDFPVTATATDPDGQYILENLAPGSYKLNFMGSAASVWNGNSLSPETAPAIVVAEGSAITGEDVTITVDPGAGSISGTVVRLGGGGVEGTLVEVRDLTGMPITETNAAADGTYTLSSLAAGLYKVSIHPSPIGSDPVWYGGTDQATATPIEVAASAAVTGIDFTLPAAASLSGTVAGYDGEAPLMVQVYPLSNHPRYGPPLGYTMVNPDGSYTVSGLPTGQVKVRLFGEIGGYANEWYGGDIRTTTVLNVTEGQTTSGINFTAVPEAVIAGQVKSPFPPDRTTVRVLNEAGNEAGDALPAEDGSYEVFGLPAGSYTVEFQASTDDGSMTSWYGGKTLASAATVTVAAGQTVTGIDSDVVKKPAPPRKPTETVPPQKPAGSATSAQKPADAEPSQEPAEVAAAATTVEPAGTATTPQAAANTAGVQRASATGAAPVKAGDEAKVGDLAPTGEAADTGSPATTGTPAAAGDLAEASAPANLAPLGLALGVLGAAGVAIFLTARFRARR
ncbi:hypothetical protein [Arthrobacter cupressi]